MDSPTHATRRAAFTFTRVSPPFGLLCELQEQIRATTGFAWFFFALRQPFPVSAPSVYAYDNYRDGTRRQYDEQQAWRHDPVLNHTGAEDTVRWERPGEPLAKWEETATGIAFRFPFGGGRQAFLSLSGASSPHSTAEPEALRTSAYLLCQRALAIAGIERKLGRLPAQPLTRRELHVLRLSADGLTAEEIAHEIFVARSTVNFHIKRITQKLQARNKSQAIARAALMSLL